MTIDEAIKHAREVASQGCTECNKNHEQLAEWLEELKVYKKALYMACNGKEYLVNDFLQKARLEE